ncbi:late embryogenesis abundant protein, group 3-like [Trifolium pratense]|uniref:Uncharacterized protein n=2 Tax=Trifolium pratense TaxID=57577 RepID=A0ACB0JU34_TRIPR|nr:late embryogenesis abundant protein, group 3-like [Trifolium pratense]CAJ2648619.1 unnamed protein product [Trifolium pratense]
MATMLSGNTLFHTSKSFPNVSSLTTLPKPSRVFFASNHSDWRNAAEGTKSISTNWGYASSTKTRRDVIVVRAAGDDIKKSAQDANEKSKDAAGSVIDKATEGTNKAVEAAESAQEKSNETAEALKNAAEKAKEQAGGAWEAAKEETQKIAETVVGKED